MSTERPVPPDAIACLECVDCGEVLRVAGSTRVEELKNALAGFMAEHVERHAGSFSAVDLHLAFRVPRELDGDLLAWPKEVKKI